MEDVLGRALMEEEQVHHRNGNRGDNHPSNLELWIKQQPPGQRVTDLVAWAVATAIALRLPVVMDGPARIAPREGLTIPNEYAALRPTGGARRHDQVFLRLAAGNATYDDSLQAGCEEKGKGYRHIRRRGRRIPVHHMVMGISVGRALLPAERVHHLNGIRDDNRIENLELWATRTQPSGQRASDHIRAIFQQYRAEVADYLMVNSLRHLDGHDDCAA